MTVARIGSRLLAASVCCFAIAGFGSVAAGPQHVVSAQRPERMGQIVGSVVVVGGPAPGAAKPIPAKVSLVSDRARSSFHVGRSGTFRRHVPVGTYRATAHSRDYGHCAAMHRRTVHAGPTTHVVISCQIP